MKLSYINLIRFRVDNASLPTSFHESQYDRWSSRTPTIVPSKSKHRWLSPAFGESCRLLRVDQAKEPVAVSCLKCTRPKLRSVTSLGHQGGEEFSERGTNY